MPKVPKSFPVRPLRRGDEARDRATCGTCGRSWDDAIATAWTPTPSARCPFEYFHAADCPPPPDAGSATRREDGKPARTRGKNMTGYGYRESNPKIDLLTMSPSTGDWQYAGTTNWSRSAKEAARRFQALHPEQTVAAQHSRSGARLVRP